MTSITNIRKKCQAFYLFHTVGFMFHPTPSETLAHGEVYMRLVLKRSAVFDKAHLRFTLIGAEVRKFGIPNSLDYRKQHKFYHALVREGALISRERRRIPDGRWVSATLISNRCDRCLKYWDGGLKDGTRGLGRRIRGHIESTSS